MLCIVLFVHRGATCVGAPRGGRQGKGETEKIKWRGLAYSLIHFHIVQQSESKGRGGGSPGDVHKHDTMYLFGWSVCRYIVVKTEEIATAN